MSDRMPPDRLNEIGVLKRREIEARILMPVLTALGDEFGRERVLEIARRIIVDVAREQGGAAPAAREGRHDRRARRPGAGPAPDGLARARGRTRPGGARGEGLRAELPPVSALCGSSRISDPEINRSAAHSVSIQ